MLHNNNVTVESQKFCFKIVNILRQDITIALAKPKDEATAQFLRL